MGEGHQWRLRQAQRERIELAWLMAMFDRQKRLQPLERYLPKSGGAKPPKTAEQRREEYEELKRRLG